MRIQGKMPVFEGVHVGAKNNAKETTFTRNIVGRLHFVVETEEKPLWHEMAVLLKHDMNLDKAPSPSADKTRMSPGLACAKALNPGPRLVSSPGSRGYVNKISLKANASNADLGLLVPLEYFGRARRGCVMFSLHDRRFRKTHC